MRTHQMLSSSRQKSHRNRIWHSMLSQRPKSFCGLILFGLSRLLPFRVLVKYSRRFYNAKKAATT